MTSESIVSPNSKQGSEDQEQDHIWVLLVLADISKYLLNSDLPQAASVVDDAMLQIEGEILRSSATRKFY